MSSFLRRAASLCAVGLVLAVATPDAAAQEDSQRGALGTQAPEFVLEGPFGGSQRFPDRTSGKIDFTVVVFWATWSKASVSELKRLLQLWPKWSNNRVQVIAVNVEDSDIDAADLKKVRDWLEASPLPFPVVLDRGLKAFHRYGVIAVPTTLVVDANGLIVFRLPGYPVAGSDELERIVEHGVIETEQAARSNPAAASPGYRRAVRQTRLARLLMEQGEMAMAQYTLDKAIAEDPAFFHSRIVLAELYENTDKAQAAEDLLHQIVGEFPAEPAALLALAGFQLRHDQAADAVLVVQSVLDLEPELGAALTMMARALLAADKAAEALPFLEQAVTLNPLDFPACLALGRTHEALQQLSEAIGWYERAYQILDPSWSYSQN